MEFEGEEILLDGTPREVTDSVAFCEERGGYLIEPRDPAFTDAVRQKVASDPYNWGYSFWLGISDIENEGV